MTSKTCTTCKAELAQNFYVCPGTADVQCNDHFCLDCGKDLLWNSLCPACERQHNGMPDQGRDARCSWCHNECNCAKELKWSVCCKECAPQAKCTKCKKEWPITKTAPRFTCNGVSGTDCERDFCAECAKDMDKPTKCTECNCVQHRPPPRNVYGDGGEPGSCDCDCDDAMKHDVVCIVCRQIEEKKEEKKPSDERVISFLIEQSHQFSTRKEVEAAMTKKRKATSSSTSNTNKKKKTK
jgi:hypothetical protein